MQDYDVHLLVYLMVLIDITVVNDRNLLMHEALLWKMLLVLLKRHILQVSISLLVAC